MPRGLALLHHPSDGSPDVPLRHDVGVEAAADVPPSKMDWADVVAKYADVVYTMAYRLTGDDEEARDLAQDVLIRLHKGLAKYREGNFEGWLYRTTVNAFRDRLRKRKRLREDVLPEEPPGMKTTGIVEEEVQRGELHRIVQRALVRLPAEYREAVVLRDLEGRSYDEIAQILGIPAGTVRSRIHRGREALRQLLESYVDDRGDVPGSVADDRDARGLGE
jgi:RNA polymerase sigma-70 factor, ECF subfamily